jgi:leucyl aminopeptidase
MTDTIIQNSNDLLNFLVTQSENRKDWFGFTQQRITAVNLAHEIAARHADKMTPEQVVEYAKELNELLFLRLIKPGAWRL